MILKTVITRSCVFFRHCILMDCYNDYCHSNTFDFKFGNLHCKKKLSVSCEKTMNVDENMLQNQDGILSYL